VLLDKDGGVCSGKLSRTRKRGTENLSKKRARHAKPLEQEKKLKIKC